MPIYEYLCGQCHTRVELFQRRRVEPGRSPPPCPLCGARRLRMALSRFAFVGGGGAADLDSLDSLDSDDPEAMPAFDALAGGSADDLDADDLDADGDW